MQTKGATLLRVRRCSLARMWMLARGSRSACGLLYLAAVRGELVMEVSHYGRWITVEPLPTTVAWP
jgi:hypothetical protein